MNKLLSLLFLPLAALASSTEVSSKSRKGSGGSRSGTDGRDIDPTACVEVRMLYEDPLDEEEMMEHFDETTNQLIVADVSEEYHCFKKALRNTFYTCCASHFNCFQALLYEDVGLQSIAMTGSYICNFIDDTRMLCNIVTTDDEGTTTLTGVSELFAESNTYVFTGGTDGYAGIAGKVTSQYNEDSDVVEVIVCLQA